MLMKEPDNLWHKAPEWSWFSGLVPDRAVWNRWTAEATQQDNRLNAIKDSLPLWLEHTVQTAIGILAHPNQIRWSSITPNLRAEVSELISAASISEKNKEALLGVLDTVPHLKFKPAPRDIPFEWEIEDFITEEERKAIVSFIQEIEGCKNEESIKLVNPRNRGRMRLIWYKIWTTWKNRIEFYVPQAGKLSITSDRQTSIVSI